MAIDVEKTLQGLDFPTNRDAIINKAQENGAGDDEISALEGLPEREYADAADVAEALVGNGENTDEEDTRNIEIMDEEPDAGGSQ